MKLPRRFTLISFILFAVLSFRLWAEPSALDATPDVAASSVSRIETAPVATAVTFGDDLVLTVGTTAGDPLTYQWMLNGGDIPGATDQTFTVADATFRHAGYYAVKVTGAETEQTEPVRVDVFPSAAPGILQPDPSWDLLVERPGMNAGQFIAAASGGFFISGDLTGMADHASFGVIKLLSDGTVDTSFAVLGLTGSVLAIAEQTDGKLVIGGAFTLRAGGKVWANLARVNADGTPDDSFAGDAMRDGVPVVQELDVAPDGSIYLWHGGAKLIRVDATGVVDTSFGPRFEQGASSSLWGRDIEVQPDNRIVVVGNFSVVNGAPHRGVVRLNPDGSVDESIGLTYAEDSSVYPNGAGEPWAVAIDGNGSIWLAIWGDFLYDGVVTNAGLLRMTATGEIDLKLPFLYGLTFNIDIANDGSAYLSGGIQVDASSTRTGILRVLADGQIDDAILIPMQNGEFRQFAINGGGRVITDGFVLDDTTGNGDYTFNYNPDFSVAANLRDSLRSFGLINGILPRADGTVWVGGDFSQLGGTPVANFARLLPNGAVDPTFNSGSGPDNVVSLLTNQADGKVYLSGSFKNYDGHAHAGFVRLNADGSFDESFGLTATFLITTIAPTTEGGLWTSGWDYDFQYNGNAGVSRFDPDGTRDRDFTVLRDGTFYPGGAALAIIEGPEGQVVKGGFASTQFDSYSLGFMSADGTVDMTAVSAANLKKSILAAVPTTDGLFVVGHEEIGLVKLGWDGVHAPGFDATPTQFLWLTGSDYPKLGLVNERDGGVVVGGPMQIQASEHLTVPANLARFDADGAWDKSLWLRGAVGSEASPFAQLRDGNFVFAEAGRLRRTEAATLTAPLIIASSHGHSFTKGSEEVLEVIATGTGALTYQWRKDGADMAGETAPTLTLSDLQWEDVGTYTVVVTDEQGSTTSADIQMTTPAPRIATPPGATAVTFGDDLVLTVGTTAGDPLTYQWMLNGGDIPGATDQTFTVADATFRHAGYYAVKVTGAETEQTEPVRVDVFPSAKPGILQPDPSWDLLLERPEIEQGQFIAAANGGFYVAADVTGMSEHSSFGVVRLNPDATVDPSFTVSGLKGRVDSIAEQPDGKVVIGGDFTLKAAGKEWSQLARLNSDGSVDTAFADDSMRPHAFTAQQVAVAPNGLIYFWSTESSGLRRTDATGVLDTAFQPSFERGVSTSLLARDIKVQSDNRVIVGGHFGIVNGNEQRGLVRFNVDGSVDDTLKLTYPEHPTAYQFGFGEPWGVTIDADGAIWVAITGNFVYDGVVANGGLLRFAAEGGLTLQKPFAQGSGFGIENAAGGGVYLYGAYRVEQSDVPTVVLKLDGAGDVDTSINIPVQNGEVRQFAVNSTGRFIMAGLLLDDPFGNRKRTLNFNPDGTQQSDLGVDLRSFGKVYSMIPQADGSVVVGGDFVRMNGSAVAHLARVLPSGALDPAFDSGTGPNGPVQLMSQRQDGKIYVYGWFREFDGNTAGGFARIESDGAFDATFGYGSNYETHAVTANAEGGLFTSDWGYNFTLRGNAGVTKVNADGTVDETFVVKRDGSFVGGTAAFAHLEGPDAQIVVGELPPINLDAVVWEF